MKIYKIKDENRYLNQGLSQLKDFEVYSLYDIIRFFDNYEFDLTTRSKQSDNPYFNLKRAVHPYHYIKQFKQPYKYIQMTMQVDKYKAFSRDKGEFSKGPGKTIAAQLRREDSIRTLVYPSHYLYFKIPYEFILDHLERIFCPTDIPKLYEAFKDVDTSIFSNIIDTFEKYDNIFTEIVETAKSKKPKWRFDVFPDMLYSMSKYGLGYPIINPSTSQIFFDGTHRLSCAPIAKIDYPILQYLAPKKNVDEPYYICTPPYFKGGKHLLLDYQIDREYIGGWFISTSLFQGFGVVHEDNRVQITQFEIFDKFVAKIAASEYDFKFEL